jgi:hypothetical protein
MKALVALLALTLTAGCKSPDPASPGVVHRKTSFQYGLGDGHTMASAVEIRAHSDVEGGQLLLDWIRANYPGYSVQQQEILEQRGRAYNLVTIMDPGHVTQMLYFDISSYYRRIDNGSFPAPRS